LQAEHLTMKHSPPRLEARPASVPASVSSRKRANAAEAIPTLAEARKRLAAHRGRVNPWLTPEALAAAEAYPEQIGPMVGPEICRKP
jgi:hypothetical protein